MKCFWIKNGASLKDGFDIINDLDDFKFEQVLKIIFGKLKLKDPAIFTEEEKQKLGRIFQIDNSRLELSIKTTVYVCKRIAKYVFKPGNLRDDLINLGLNNEKAEIFIKAWSEDTKTTINDLGKHEAPSFSWKLNAELSSDVCKKSKIPKAYLALNNTNKNTEVELLHSDLYSIFLQLEAVQHELDNLM